jgi:hypothetical protein
MARGQVSLMKVCRLSALVLLVLCFCVCRSFKAQAYSAWSHSERMMIFDPSKKHSVEEDFSSSLSPVPAFLKEGETFDKSFVEGYYKYLQKEVKVSEVPPWIYGTWKSDKQVQDFTYIYGNGLVSENIELNIDTYDTIGDVKAADKKIYTIISLGSIDSLVRGSNLVEYQINLADDRLASFGKYICRDSSIRMQIDPVDNRIVKVFQVESEKIYRPSFDGSNMLADGWMKSFTQDGQPFILSHSKSLKTLIEKHELIDLEKMDTEKAYTGVNP